MPGVPSGRGCNGCRKQKKKCDQAKPSCSRCVRLGLVCIGAGQQRYKFMEPQFSTPTTSDSSTKDGSTPLPPTKLQPSTVVLYPLSNQLTSIRHQFVTMIDLSTDIRYNLAASFGAYLQDVPQRLGTSEALDAAAAVLVTAHSQQCLGRGNTPESVIGYSTALRKLRYTLDDPEKARTSETLCAVMILQLCQTLLGFVEGNWTGHAEGMVMMLAARGSYAPSSAFETKLLHSMRGVVIFEGLMNSRIRLSIENWKTLASDKLDRNQYEAKFMRSLRLVPYFIESRSRHLDYSTEELDILEEIQSAYEDLKPVVDRLRNQMRKILLTEASTVNVLANAVILRFYGLALTIASILNLVLGAVEPENPQFHLDAHEFAHELLAVSEMGKVYCPMGGMLMMLFISYAWMATTDLSIRATAQRQLFELYDHPSIKHMSKSSIAGLDWAARRLRLENPPLPSDDLNYFNM